MSSRTCIGVGLALAVAIGCSTNNSSSLGGSGSSSGSACPTGTDSVSGQGYVQTEGCPTCHTSDMSGTLTPLGGQPAGVYLYPPNLTPDMQTGIGSWSDGDLQLAITQGIDKNSEELCPEMQHYPNMCANEQNGIIAYLRSIPAVSKQVPRSICPPLKKNPDGGL